MRPSSLEDDLRRWDFTVNAMLMDLDGRVADHLPAVGQGRTDLAAHVLRTPVDPEVTFADDPLRMLRAVRFALQLDFELASGLLLAMRRMRERVRSPKLFVERVNVELRKVLLSDDPARALELLDAGGLLEVPPRWLRRRCTGGQQRLRLRQHHAAVPCLQERRVRRTPQRHRHGQRS